MFHCFYALKGYHHCPLEIHIKMLTTFMICFGRLKFLRAPFGLCSIFEHYNRRMENTFLGLKNYRRVVDDVIIFNDNESDHAANVRQFLQRCSDKGISLYRDKFKFYKTGVTSAGYHLSLEEYKIDDSFLIAIREFFLPANATNLRSFFGLANQLSSNTAKIAQCLPPFVPF